MKTKDILRHELIGLEIKVTDSENKDNIGISGKIIDETKETVVIEHENKKKSLFKKNIKFETKVNNQTIIVNGKKLQNKSFKRIKK